MTRPGPSNRKCIRTLLPLEESLGEDIVSPSDEQPVLLTRKRKESAQEPDSGTAITSTSEPPRSLQTNGLCLLCTQLSKGSDVLTLPSHKATLSAPLPHHQSHIVSDLRPLEDIMRNLKVNPLQLIQHIDNNVNVSGADGVEENYEMFTELCGTCWERIQRATNLQRKKKKQLRKLASRIVISDTTFENVQVLGTKCGDNPIQFAHLLRGALKKACKQHHRSGEACDSSNAPNAGLQDTDEGQSRDNVDNQSAVKDSDMQSHHLMDHLLQSCTVERYTLFTDQERRICCNRLLSDVMFEAEVVHSTKGPEKLAFECGYCNTTQPSQKELYAHLIEQHKALLNRKLKIVLRSWDHHRYLKRMKALHKQTQRNDEQKLQGKCAQEKNSQSFEVKKSDGNEQEGNSEISVRPSKQNTLEKESSEKEQKGDKTSVEDERAVDSTTEEEEKAGESSGIEDSEGEHSEYTVPPDNEEDFFGTGTDSGQSDQESSEDENTKIERQLEQSESATDTDTSDEDMMEADASQSANCFDE